MRTRYTIVDHEKAWLMWSEGGMSMRNIADREDMPSRETISRWANGYECPFEDCNFHNWAEKKKQKWEQGGRSEFDCLKDQSQEEEKEQLIDIVEQMSKKFDKKYSGISVYIIEAGNKYKIGISNNPQRRVSTINTANPFEVKLVYSAPVLNPHKLENRLHKKYSEKKIKGEWFNLDKNDIEKISQKIYEKGKNWALQKFNFIGSNTDLWPEVKPSYESTKN